MNTVLKLDRVPRSFRDGPFWGNGRMGALLYVRDNELHFALDHVRLWEMREDGADSGEAGKCGQGRMRLPGLGLNLALPFEITSFQCETRLDIATSFLLINDRMRAEIYLDANEDMLSVRLFGENAQNINVYPNGWDLESPQLEMLKRRGYEVPEINRLENGVEMRQMFSGNQMAFLAAKWDKTDSEMRVRASLAVENYVTKVAYDEYAAEGQKRYAAHAATWRKFWQSSCVSVPDAAMQEACDAEMYKLFACTNGVVSPLISARSWNDDTCMPPCDEYAYVDDGSALKTGRGALRASFVDGCWQAKGMLEARAQTLFGVQNAIDTPAAMAPNGDEAFYPGKRDNFSPEATLFLGVDLVAYYEYTLDEVRLREKIYPFVAEILCMYETLSAKAAASAEHVPGENLSIAAARVASALKDKDSFVCRALRYLTAHMIKYARRMDAAADAARFSALAAALVLPAAEESVEGTPGNLASLLGLYLPPSMSRDLFEEMTTGTGAPALPALCQAMTAAWNGQGNRARTMLHLAMETGRGVNSFSRRGSWHAGMENAADTAGRSGMERMFPAVVCDMLAHRLGDDLCFFAGVPDDWARCEFSGIQVEGGHRLSGKMSGYFAESVQICAGRSETLRVSVRNAPGDVLRRDARVRAVAALAWEITLKAGETVELRFLPPSPRLRNTEEKEWTSVWQDQSQDLFTPRSLVIGDSIANGYRCLVNDETGDRMHVDTFATSKALDHVDFVAELETFVRQAPRAYSVVQINNGLHGWHLSASGYEMRLSRLVHCVSRMCPEAKIIIALTTPKWMGGTTGAPDAEKNGVVLARNNAAIRVARECRAEVNDLYTLMSKNESDRQSDGYHYTEKGYRRLAHLVAERLLQGLSGSAF